MTVTKSKTTMGPWEVRRVREAWHVVSARLDRSVAAVLWGPDSEANAWLMAAAPDLLRECVYLLSLWERGENFDSEIVHLRRAIAKARGEAPLPPPTPPPG